ncbi:MAG: hypothetical protein H0V93_06580 [Euzebyales bacterium]|nr:hypothetical protein [Euzebyales bacterium]
MRAPSPRPGQPVRGAIAVLLVMAFAIAPGLVPPALAEPTRDDLAAAEARLAELDADFSSAVERYHRAQDRLSELDAHAEEVGERIATVEAVVASRRADVQEPAEQGPAATTEPTAQPSTEAAPAPPEPEPGQMVHAPSTGKTVSVASAGRSDYVGAARPGG